MIAVLQRVNRACVRVSGEVVGEIGRGLLVWLGVTGEDTREDGEALAKKIAAHRIFTDENDKMNLSLTDVGGRALVVSNFTLCADYSHGNRPSFFAAAAPEAANEAYLLFCQALASHLGAPVARGEFGADMKIDMEADGPVTIVMDSRVLTKKGKGEAK